jgi:hypothetical protein
MIRRMSRAMSRMAVTVVRRLARMATQGAMPTRRVMAAIAATGIGVAIELAPFFSASHDLACATPRPG